VLTEHPRRKCSSVVTLTFVSRATFFENLGCGLYPDEGFKAEAGALPPLRQSRLPRTVR